MLAWDVHVTAGNGGASGRVQLESINFCKRGPASPGTKPTKLMTINR